MTNNLKHKSILVAAMLAMFVPNVHASEGIQVYDTDLRVLLQTASKLTGQKIEMSPALKGVVRTQDLPADVPKLLTMLQDDMQLDWYKDTGTVYVSGKNESVSRVVGLGKIKFNVLTEAMNEAKIDITNHELRFMSDANSIYFTGPPSLAGRVQALIRNLNLEKNNQRPVRIKQIRAGVVSYQEIEDKEE